MTPIDKILPLLSGVKPSGAGKWLAKCPAHDDRSPSLGIRQVEDGRLLLHCFSGCSVSDIVGAVGLTLSDLFPEDLNRQDKPIKQAFSASMVLDALAQETLIVSMIANRMIADKDVTPKTFDRLVLAGQRIEEGLRLAGLYRG